MLDATPRTPVLTVILSNGCNQAVLRGQLVVVLLLQKHGEVVGDVPGPLRDLVTSSICPVPFLNRIMYKLGCGRAFQVVLWCFGAAIVITPGPGGGP